MTFQSMNALLVLLIALMANVSAAETISTVDDSGYRVELAQPAQRVIGLAPHIVENLYSAGAGDKIVAAVAFSNYPEAAKNLPHVGSYNTFNVEAILALKPDLIVAWASGTKPAQVEHMRRIGIPVYMSNPHSLEDLAKTVRALGQLTGTHEYANTVADTYLRELQDLRERYSDSAAVSAFYQVWNKPLQTLNGEHLVSNVIKVCGGNNVFADASSIAPKINIEAVIQRDPQVIIASGMAESRPEWLDDWKEIPTLSAVKNNNLFFVPPDLLQRHSLRVLKGAELICEQFEQVRQKLAPTD